MPYATTTWLQLRQRLALRLFDTANTFWVSTEIQILLKEALRTFGLLTGFNRAEGVVTTALNTASTPYVLTTSFVDTATATNTLAPSVTDRDIIQLVQYHLLEVATSQASWGGTEMFTYNDLVEALQRRLNRFLGDTGIIVSNVQVVLGSGGQRVVAIPSNILDVRYAVWIPDNNPALPHRALYREDERMMTASDPTWPIGLPLYPEAYSVMATPPTYIELMPTPNAIGTLDLLVVQEGATLNPASAATVLGIPDDLTPALKWGVLADVLGKDGIARDPVRAAYCEMRYQQYVELARILPVILHAFIQGAPTIPCTLSDIDAYDPDWRTATLVAAPPTDICIAGPLIFYMHPRPIGAYDITLDVVRRTPLPTADGDFIQLSEDHIDALLDYAEHLALFKVGGAEWHATERQAKNFLIDAATYNQRVSAAARAVFSAADQSEMEKQSKPRRLKQSGVGTGAMRGLIKETSDA